MSVWFAIPSARPAEEAAACLFAWAKKGYSIAVWRDTRWLDGEDALIPALRAAETRCLVLTGPHYPGWAGAINALSAEILRHDPCAEWIVTGGDDTWPDPDDPEKIARECREHFGGTMGIMQPTGDPFASDPVTGQHSIERFAGSPWLGREWCERGNRGAGPFHAEATHMFADQILQEAAIKFGIFWQRPDLVHEHRHWTRQADDSAQWTRPMPKHLLWANGPDHWDQTKAIYERVKAGGFEECMPMPKEEPNVFPAR